MTTTTTTDTTRHAACPSWCTEALDPQVMNDGTIELVHGHHVVAVPLAEPHEAHVYLERVDVLELDAGGVSLTAGPLVLRVMLPDEAPTMTADQGRALARALDAAATTLDRITDMDASDVSPTMACNGHHVWADGRCSRCTIVQPGAANLR